MNKIICDKCKREIVNIPYICVEIGWSDENKSDKFALCSMYCFTEWAKDMTRWFEPEMKRANETRYIYDLLRE